MFFSMASPLHFPPYAYPAERERFPFTSSAFLFSAVISKPFVVSVLNFFSSLEKRKFQQKLYLDENTHNIEHSLLAGYHMPGGKP